MRVLFIVKKREGYDAWNKTEVYSYSNTLSSGLLNSSQMVSFELAKHVEAKTIEVVDNNEIDKEVHHFKPDVVVIEALWVVPSKFKELVPLHPHVKWIVRLHSNTPFIASEGIALQWCFEYLKHKNVYVAPNHVKLYKELRHLAGRHEEKVLHLPNFYELEEVEAKKRVRPHNEVNIGCFGAIRPLKNQLIQAVSAIQFADTYNYKLKFFINVTRVETRGDSVLQNIRALFKNSDKHELVEIEWLDHKSFLKFLKENIDLGLQVSFTETFNIVGADYVSQDIPIVASKEIDFVLAPFQADPTSSKDIVSKMEWAWFARKLGLTNANRHLLKSLNKKAIRIWVDTLTQI